MNKFTEYFEANHDSYVDYCKHVRAEIKKERHSGHEKIWELAKDPEEKHKLTRDYLWREKCVTKLIWG